MSILSNESYHQLRQVNFSQMFGLRQRYCMQTSLFWQDLSFGTKPFISASFILYIHQGISISGIRFHFTKYIIFLIFKKKINLIHHNFIRVPSADALYWPVCPSVRPSVLLSVCPSEITCPGHFVSPFAQSGLWFTYRLSLGERCVVTLSRSYKIKQKHYEHIYSPHTSI